MDALPMPLGPALSMQDPASFNLDAVKKQIDAAIKNQPEN
jgi:hypothetical protein